MEYLFQSRLVTRNLCENSFDYIFNEIGNINREETIIVGDSLTSDVMGGLNANIQTCWFNYREKKITLIYNLITRSVICQN